VVDQGSELPGYVEQVFEDYLKCGWLEHVFLRVCCSSCEAEHLVALNYVSAAAFAPVVGHGVWRKARCSRGAWHDYPNLTHRPSTAVSSAHELQRRAFNGKGYPRVGDFLRVRNDPIQPLEKSASKLMICNERNFRACGLQNFDARRAERRRGRRERNRALNGLPDRVAKSAGTLRNPRKHAGPCNEKGQPRAVGLYELVEESGTELPSASTP